MRFLGIDYGSKMVGVAVSDENGTMAFPNTVLQNNRHLLDAVVSLIHEQRVGEVVIGESLNAQGEENNITKEARAFGERLKEKGISVAFHTEALTTQEARRDIEGNRITGGRVDAAAAALMLTSYLGNHGNH